MAEENTDEKRTEKALVFLYGSRDSDADSGYDYCLWGTAGRD